MSSLWSVGSTVWWISLVAFQTRNRPPAIRIRSRHEKPWPKAEKTGAVMPTIQEIVASRISRMTSAAEIPSRRACTRCSAGSLLVRIEMKIRLSMPSTTSMAISVTIAAQPSGLVRKAKWVAKNSVIGRLLGSSVRSGPLSGRAGNRAQPRSSPRRIQPTNLS